MNHQAYMIVLGIESTAHTFGVAVIKDEEVLSNERDAYKTEDGGMKPSELSEHHVQVCQEVLRKAIMKAKIKPEEIDVIAYSKSPGIGHALRIGAVLARSLAVLLNKPIVGVNHCIAHLEIGRMQTPAKDPVLLYASGANTQIIAYDGGKYRVFGETLDMGIGNFLDSIGRELGIGFPAGPTMEKLALKGKKYIKLPYNVKGMDVSFGGLYTNVKNKILSGKYSKEDLCYSIQETVFAMLVEVAERAMAHCDKKELLLGGGVAANKRLQEMAAKMCEGRNAECYVPEIQYLIDNAAMIAWTGLLIYKSQGGIPVEEAGIDPYERTDEVEIKYRD